MKKQIKRELYFSGNHSTGATDVIASITSLLKDHKISVDGISMNVVNKNDYMASISSDQFPENNHAFWTELLSMANNFNIKVDLTDMEDR